MSKRSKRGAMPYLPRYKPLLSAVPLPNRSRRYSYPDTRPCSRVFTYYIDGSPARVINSYRAPEAPSYNKSSRIFLCSPSLGHHVTRVTGSASLNDLSSSHVYTRPGSILGISNRRCDDDNADTRQNICDRSSFCLDMTPSESGVSVGESEDWSVFGREDDNTSQHSSASWSTFCDNDLDRRGHDNCSCTRFHGDRPRGFHHGSNDDDNFRNGNQNDYMSNQDSQNLENTHNGYSLNQDVRKTLKTVNTSCQIVNTGDELDSAPDLDSHPGILYESVEHNSRHTTEHTLMHTACVGYREDWQCESCDSVECDACCSSEWCRFPQLGKFDDSRGMLHMDIIKYADKHADSSCDNGFSEGFYSDDLDSIISSVSGDTEVTRVVGGMDVTKLQSSIEVMRTCGNTGVTREHDNRELTKTYGDMELANTYGNMELTRTPGDMELTKIYGEPEATRFYSRPNSLVISSGDKTNSRVHGQKGSQCGASSDGVCFQSKDGVQEVRDVKSVADGVQEVRDVKSVADGVQEVRDVKSEADVQAGTNVYSSTNVRGGTDGYRFTELYDSAHVYNVTNEVLDCADVYRIPGKVQDCIDMHSVTDGVHGCTDVFSVTDSVLEDSDVHDITEEVCVDTDVHSVTNVQNSRGLYSVKDEVQEGTYVYSLAEEIQEFTNVYSVTDKVQEGAFVDSVPDGAQKCTAVYNVADEVQKCKRVYSVTIGVEKGMDVYSGKVNKRSEMSNDDCAGSHEHRAVDTSLTAEHNDAKESFPEMFSKHNFPTSGETWREMDFQLDEQRDGGSTGTCSENQVLYNIGQAQTNDVTGVQKLNQHINLQTIMPLCSEDNSVKLYDSSISQTVLATNKSGMSNQDSGVLPGIRLCIIGDSHNGNELCVSEMADDDDATAPTVFDKNVLLPAYRVVDEYLVGYNRTIGDVAVSNYPLLNSGDRVKGINDIDSDKTALLLLPEIVSKDDVNRWGLPRIREQRCVNAPYRRAIDSWSESTGVSAEQIPLQQSSVCRQHSASVDAGINKNNTSVENVIDSSKATTKCLSCASEFWEETQSSETVSEKTESIESKYTELGINTDSSQTPPVKQRTARVSRQFDSQLVISFDSCDVSGKLHFCVCCGKRRKTFLYGLVCAHCVINLYNNSATAGEQIINYCCGREDIDWSGGIPVSILDESIKHAREKLRRNKGSQHVGYFCAETQGVGSGKTDEIIRYDRREQQEVINSSSTLGSHTVDYQRTVDTQAVHTNLLSTLTSGTDKPCHLVLSQVSNQLDTASKISETCQVNNGNLLFSGFAAQDAVSIDKTSTDTLSSYSHVPPDFINLTASSDIRLNTNENLASIAPVCFTSLASSISPRDTTSNIQKMQGNCSNLDMNTCVSSANVLDLDQLVCASDSTHRSRDSSPVDVFTSGCHGSPLDKLHAQLSFISGNSFSERCPFPEYVATDIYRARAEATCSWKLGHVGDTRDDVDFSNTPGSHAIQQNFTTYSRSLHLNQSPTRTDILEVPATKEEYDNDDTYVTAQTQRGSRLLPRSYHQMYLVRYGQAKASSLWTVPEEPENICDETASHSSPPLPVKTSSIRNRPSDQTMFVSRKPYTTEDDIAEKNYSSIHKTSSKKCTLGNESSITVEDSLGVFDAKDNGGTHQPVSSERVPSFLLERDYVSLDVKSNRIHSPAAEIGATEECGSNKTKACDSFLAGVDKNIVASCPLQDSLVTFRQGCGDSSADDSDRMCHKRSAVCQEVPRERCSGSVSVLDRLSYSLSQFGRHGVDLVYDRKSLFREDTADSDAESEECHSSSHTRDVTHTDRSGVSDLGYNDSGIVSDLDSSTSSDSIKHIHFTSTGKAEFRDASFDDYDNVVSPRSRSDLVETQIGFNQIVKHSDTSVKSFEKIVEEMNISMSRLQEIAHVMLSQDEILAKNTLPTPDCEGLYRAFTNEEVEKQQNHKCVVVEDEDVSKYRFKRFLKKSHNKRKKGLKILRFFSRLSCVTETATSPICSPVTSRKVANKCGTMLNAEPEVLRKQALSDRLLVNGASCYQRETHSLSSVCDCNFPSTSNQSLDSVPSKTDSAYSSFSESTEAADSNSGNTATSNSQVHAFPDHATKGVNMDSSIGSCSSSLDSSSISLEVDVIQVSALDGVSLGTAAPKNSAPSSRRDNTLDIFHELNTCEGEVDTALLTHMRYGHTPAKVDKTWG